MFKQEQIDKAAELQEASKAALYRDDGARHYGDEEHAEREAAIDQEFNATMDAMAAEADQRIAGAEETLFVAENADPTDLLSTEELSQANARRPFVSDEVYTMELDKLADRCRAVLKQGERPVMFLYSLYAGQRVGVASSAGSSYVELKYGGGGASDEPGAEAVREVVGELKARLDPHGQKERAAARKAAEEARGLKNYAYYRRRGARNAGELHVKQTYGRTG